MSSRKQAILVSGSDAGMLGLLRRQLEADGYRVMSANTLSEVFRLVREESPALVLLDPGLLGLGGLEVCRRLREFSEVPLIVMGDHEGKEAVVHGLEAGADAYLTKPFSRRLVLARVRAVLRRARVYE